MHPALPALAALLIIAALALLWLLVSAAFLLWGARLAGIERRSFGRAIGTILVGGIASALLSTALGAAPLLGASLGFRFIGWLLLAICTLGIGLLWLQPYMAVSNAHFYDDIQGKT